MPSDGRTSRIESEEIGVPGGISVTIVNLGATIRSIQIPVDGQLVDVVLSYADVEDYRADPYYLGSTVGRVANRIANARFMLGQDEVQVNANESGSGHCLHGGVDGLSKQVFDLEPGPDSTSVQCRHVSPTGCGGFPGNLEVEVTYTCLDENSLAIDFVARADDDTVVNLANHGYFNLGGEIDEHELRVVSDQYTPVDETLIPTGAVRGTGGSRFDLRKLARIGNAVFDQNFVLPPTAGELRLAAELNSPATGICLKVHTTQPALQVYTADKLGSPFSRRQGLCLEAQGFPDAPNHPGFPSIRLLAEETYRERTVYEFGVVGRQT